MKRDKMDLKNVKAELKRGVSEFIDLEKIEKLIETFYKTGENFFVKIGMDPTASDLHLGHSVVLNKIAFLQKHGGVVYFLIGDFTAQIGDPSGKNSTRKKLDKDEVLKHAKTYKEQVFKILDESKTKVVFNSTWLNELGAAGMVELTSTFSVARMLERDDFEKRLKAGSPISICEFMYPLLQGYDSAHLKNDLEIGGTDQKFNLLMGRTMQRAYGSEKEQALIMMPLLEGLDGVNKMSKSLNNYIGINEHPNEIYAKTLSISDTLMLRYYELLSSKSLEEIEKMKALMKEGKLHPKRAKEELALELVARFYDDAKAKAAKAEFDKVHSQHGLPSEIASFELDLEEGGVGLLKALVFCKLESSNSAARRAVQANSVSINGDKCQDEKKRLEAGEYTLQLGKRKFAKLKVK